MIKRLCALFLPALLVTVLATSSAAAEPPTAGDALRQAQENKVQLPKKDSRDAIESNIKDIPQNDDRKKEDTTILVNEFRLEGQTIYTASQLLPLINEYKGKELTLAQMREAAAKISNFYRQHGYVAAIAYLPAQKMENNILTIKIMEGRYGNIAVNNPSRLNPAIFHSYFQDIQTGTVVNINQLQSAILQIDDLNGIETKSILKPGAQAGEVDLDLSLNGTKPLSGYLQFTNNGNDYTGKNLAGFGVSINNMLHYGDILSFSGLAGLSADSNGKEINNGSVNYQLPTAIRGLSLGIGYSKLNYQLGDEYETLGYNGIAKIFSLSAKYTLKRSYRQNSALQLIYEDKRLTDNVDSQYSSTSKKDKLFTLGYSGNFRDDRGMTAYSLNIGMGNLDSPYDTNATNGHFIKYNLELVRYQTLTDRLAVYGSVKAQWANKNMDSSERFSLGGMNGVRAYPIGQISGDEATLASLELRYSLPVPKGNSLQAVAFYDTGRVKINKDPSITGTEDQNTVSLDGAGIGLIWNKGNTFSFKVSYAWKLGNEQAIDGKNGRLWVETVTCF
ncbi:MAG TPA: ShlB/FhaC/HecB family hemolysin secretion/activation protein [Patescibacteria group bacterium]|nr:ShlB/FhaC/HecB family hemolysin secretion/activation protein [Patescibacteria group bacterium]